MLLDKASGELLQIHCYSFDMRLSMYSTFCLHHVQTIRPSSTKCHSLTRGSSLCRSCMYALCMASEPGAEGQGFQRAPADTPLRFLHALSVTSFESCSICFPVPYRHSNLLSNRQHLAIACAHTSKLVLLDKASGSAHTGTATLS